ncbi:MAG: hypothetical protein HYX94_09135 [Chloroflexi bacterium]|nr:hypothetical protein [Chloroflexota bacterium]
MRLRFGQVTFALVGLVALILASCTSTPAAPTATTSAPTTAPTSAPATATPDGRPQGSIKIGVDFRAGGSLDPVLGADGPFANIYRHAIFDPLQIVQANGAPGPGIVEKWEIAPDGLSQTFYIRKGVKFSNGDDLTAADVKFSIERLMGADSLSYFKTTWASQIASVDVKDANTIVLRMKQPTFLLLGDMQYNTAVVMPKKYFEEKGADNFAKNPVGSGPWKVVRYQPGTVLELEAMDNHWRGKPQFKNIVVTHIAEEAAKIAMLKTGELDMAEVPFDSIAGLKAAGVKTVGYDSGAQMAATLFWDTANPDKYPLGNVKVRKGLQWAINNQEIIDSLVGGNGGKYALTFVNQNAPFLDPSVLKLDPYDADGAKKLLAEAGYPSGFAVKMWEHGGFQSTITSAIAGYWRKIGVNVEQVPIDSGAYVSMFSPKESIQNNLNTT